MVQAVRGAAGARRARRGRWSQTLERPLPPGEVSLDELERAFRETPGSVPPVPAPAAPAAAPSRQSRLPTTTNGPTARSPTSRSASTSIRSKT